MPIFVCSSSYDCALIIAIADKIDQDLCGFNVLEHIYRVPHILRHHNPLPFAAGTTSVLTFLVEVHRTISLPFTVSSSCSIRFLRIGT